MPETDEKIAPALIEGTVMRSGGGVYEVDVPEEGAGRVPLICELGGRLKKGKRAFAQPVSVGDRVKVRPVETSGANARGQTRRDGYIEEILPRRSALGRARYNKTAQVTVANLDQVVVVMALRDPDLNTHRLDRFLVLAEANELRGVVCLNKADLVKKREFKKEFEPIIALYRGLGYPVVVTAAQKDIGVEDLRNELRGHISAFIGSSGVGKSSLVMMTQPELLLWVGEVMEIGKGRHTTTEVTLHPLDGGGYVADTPGIKTVSLLEREEINLEHCFPEFRPILELCKFNDCTHRTEPGCAVRAAREKGEIAASRYDSYLKMFEEAEAAPPVYARKNEGRG